MSAITLPMKTAYSLEYVPRGGRKPRLEAVSETVPVLVGQVDEMVPAVVETNSGDAKVFVSEGALYEDAFGAPTTLAEFSDAMADEEAARWTGMPGHPWFIDRTLLDEGLKNHMVFSANPREQLDAREFLRDGRLHGLAQAQVRADNFLVSGSLVYRRVAAPPSLVVMCMNGRAFVRRSYHPAPASTEDLPSKAFRIGDTETVLDYLRRRNLDIEGAVENVEEASGGLAWTEAGLTAENMPAWWLLWSADRLTRYPEESRSGSSFISQGPLVVRKLMDLADIVRQDDHLLLPATVAAERAEQVIPLMLELGGMVGRDRTVFRGMMNYLVDEYRIDTMRRDFDGMAMDIPRP